MQLARQAEAPRWGDTSTCNIRSRCFDEAGGRRDGVRGTEAMHRRQVCRCGGSACRTPRRAWRAAQAGVVTRAEASRTPRGARVSMLFAP